MWDILPGYIFILWIYALRNFHRCDQCQKSNNAKHFIEVFWNNLTFWSLISKHHRQKLWRVEISRSLLSPLPPSMRVCDEASGEIFPSTGILNGLAMTQVHIVDHPLHAKALLRRQSFLSVVQNVQYMYVVSLLCDGCTVCSECVFEQLSLASVNEWFYVLYGMHILEVWFGAPFGLFASRLPGKSLYYSHVGTLIFLLHSIFHSLVSVLNEKQFVCLSMEWKSIPVLWEHDIKLSSLQLSLSSVLFIRKELSFVLLLPIRFLSYLPSCSTTANSLARPFFHKRVQSIFPRFSLLALTDTSNKMKTRLLTTMIKKFLKLLIR